MEWTTDWFEEEGVFVIWSFALGFSFVEYQGGGVWFELNGCGSDTRGNWEDCRELFCAPIYRTVHAIDVPGVK